MLFFAYYDTSFLYADKYIYIKVITVCEYSMLMNLII